MPKKKVYESTTPNWQRISIWVIAIVMSVGTLLTFFVMVFAGQNSDLNATTIAQKKQQEEQQKYMNSDAYKAYIKQQEEAKAKLRALDGYTDKVGSFNAGDVTSLSVETLKEGDGATVKSGDTISANYTGWLPSGTIFDSTKSEGSDASPASFELSKSKVIEGWVDGLVGKRAGGVYLMAIPSDLAYGESGSGSDIPANTPLKFIVQIVSTTSP